MRLGIRQYLLYQALRHSIKSSCKSETERANTMKDIV